MEAYCITIKGYTPSEQQAIECKDSMILSNNNRWLNFNTFNATTPDEVEYEYNKRKLRFHNNIPTKAACAMSHLRLWELCANSNEPIVVLEHDAVFMLPATDKDLDLLLNSRFLTIALYWPGGHSIRLPMTKDKFVIGVEAGVCAKGYMIKPEGAERLLALHSPIVRQNDTTKFKEFPYQAGFYKEIIDDSVYLDKNLRTSHGYSSNR